MIGKRILIVAILCAPLPIAIFLPAWFDYATPGMADVLVTSYIAFLIALGTYLMAGYLIREIFHKK